MGKEAKIGVAVIAVLLLTLGAVITWRLMSAGPADEAAASEPTGDDRSGHSNASASGEGSTAATDEAESSHRRSASDLLRRVGGSTSQQQPTVLSPKSGTSGASVASSGVDRGWERLVGTGSASASDTAADDPAQPSYMPSPPSPAAAEPQGRYGSATTVDDRNGMAAQSRYGGYDQPRHYGGTSGDPFQRGSNGDTSSRQVQPSPPVPEGPSSSDSGYPSRYGPGFDRSQSAPSTDRWSSGDTADPSRSTSTAQSMQRSSSSTSMHIGVSDRSGATDFADDTAGRSADGTYSVQPNDNYWIISEKLYGTGAYFKALVEHNRDRVDRPNDLQVGEVIETPDVAQLEQDYPELCPAPEHRYVPQDSQASLVSHRQGGKMYTVGEGDTLFRIALYELGDVKRWAEIYRLNREVIGEDFDHLRPGTELVLPTSREAGDFGEPAPARSGDAVTRRPGASWNR